MKNSTNEEKIMNQYELRAIWEKDDLQTLVDIEEDL